MKKICLIILAILFTIRLSAQNLPQVDYKPVHWGFFIGLNTLDYGIKHHTDSKIRGDINYWTPGFTAGLIGDVRLNNYFNIRLAPALNLGFAEMSFLEGNIDENGKFHADKSIAPEKFNMTSTSISIPLHIKYSAVRILNYKPYVLLGGGVNFELNHDMKPTNPLLQNLMDYFIEFGVGCTIYTPYFRFSPEFKFALGFNNKLVPTSEREGSSFPDQPQYADAISRLTTRMFTLVLNFE